LSEELSTKTLESIVRLNLTRGVGARTYYRLVAAFGSAEAILEAPRHAIERVEGVSEAVAEAIAGGCEADAQAELELVGNTGAEVITIEHPDYPETLKKIYDPPLVLYVRGHLRRDEPALAVVGTRRPTYYGRQQAAKIAGSLAMHGWSIVGGLARGIDAAAHEAALAAGGKTIAVLGSGLLKVYPPENRKLADQIAEGGAVVSEFPMTAVPDPWNFPRRNRVISGLCRGVIVIEAAASSGSLITATWAVEQNRLVFALPGRVDSLQSAGCHALIRDGATLIEDADDVLGELGSPLSHEPERELVPVMPADLSDGEKKLAAALGREPKHIDDLIAETGMPAAQVSSGLVMLEIKKVAVQLPGKNFALS